MTADSARLPLKAVDRNWIGAVPEHWDTALLKLVARLESGHTPSRLVPEYWENCTIPWFTLGDVWQLREKRRKYVSDTSEMVSELGVTNSSARVLPAGTVMLSRTASVGFTGIMAREMATTQDFVNWVCGPKLRPEYLWYSLQAMSPEYDRLRFGSTHHTIYMPDVAQFKVPVPPIHEQEHIAKFLDEQTARIDALIVEKEALLELLPELQMQAVDHAVLGREFDGDGRALKGVEQLGRIPSHWTSSRLKYELEYVTSGSRGWADYYADDGALFIRIGNLTRNSVDLDHSDIQRVALPEAAEGTRARVRAGDLLISITAYLGSVAVAPLDLEEAYVSQHVALARPTGRRAQPRWLGYVLLSSVGRTFFDLQAYGGTKVQLSLEDIREVPVPLPPLEEQARRIETLELRLQNLRETGAHVQQHIERLREYRFSLISYAVTGQLDIGDNKTWTEERLAA